MTNRSGLSLTAALRSGALAAAIVWPGQPDGVWAGALADGAPGRAKLRG